jgi:hypothetical protein
MNAATVICDLKKVYKNINEAKEYQKESKKNIRDLTGLFYSKISEFLIIFFTLKITLLILTTIFKSKIKNLM